MYFYILSLVISFCSLHAMENTVKPARGIIHAPAGMTLLQAFKIFIEKARVLDAEHGIYSFNEEITQVIQQPEGHLDYYAKRQCSLINFKEFPLMNIQKYDDTYGEGAAQQALDDYKQLAMYRKMSSPTPEKMPEEDEDIQAEQQKFPQLSFSLRSKN